MANRYYYSHFRSRGIEAHRHMHYHKELTSELQRQDMCLEKKSNKLTAMTHLLSTYYGVKGLTCISSHSFVIPVRSAQFLYLFHREGN